LSDNAVIGSKGADRTSLISTPQISPTTRNPIGKGKSPSVYQNQLQLTYDGETLNSYYCISGLGDYVNFSVMVG